MPSKKVAITTKNVTDVLIRDINADAGETVLMYLSDLKEKQKQSTGIPHLDNLLRGGIPKGGIVLLTGKAQSGKTALALSIAGKCDDVVYLDGDRSLTRERAEAFGGHGNYIIAKPKTLEWALEKAILFAKAGMKLVVLDSLPSIPTKRQLENKTMDKQAGMALTAGLLSQVLGGVNAIFDDMGATLLIVDGLRANTNVINQYVEQYHPFGGLMLPSIAGVTIQTAHMKWMKDPTLEVYGHEIAYLVAKSKYSPGRVGGSAELVPPYGFVEHEKLGDIRAELRKLQKEGKYTPIAAYDEVVTVEEVNDEIDDMMDEK